MFHQCSYLYRIILPIGTLLLLLTCNFRRTLHNQCLPLITDLSLPCNSTFLLTRSDLSGLISPPRSLVSLQYVSKVVGYYIYLYFSLPNGVFVIEGKKEIWKGIDFYQTVNVFVNWCNNICGLDFYSSISVEANDVSSIFTFM